MGRRLHCWVYSLWYPALLGTFLVTLLIRPTPTEHEPWGWLLVIYFTLQHVEGTLDSAQYDLIRFIVDDFAEMVLMVWSFALLYPNSLPVVEGVIAWSSLPWVLTGVFALPVGYRFVRERAKLREDHRSFYWTVSIMSVIAIGATALWAFGVVSEQVAFWVILCLLTVYGLLFVVFNEQAARLIPSIARPPAAA